VKRVLLTGGTGFIGRHAGPLLRERGYEVHAVSSTDDGPRADGIEWHRADLLEPDTTRALVGRIEPTHLLHLAWYAEPREFWTSPRNLDWVEASLRLLRSFAAGGGERAVLAGSCAEYDWSHGRCSETETPLLPATLYGVCKHALQIVGSRFASGAGLSFGWGRIFFVYGPHEHPARLVPAVSRALLQGRPAPCSLGEQERDFVYSEDVADAFVHILDSDVQAAVNIGSGQPVAVKDVVSTIGSLTGRTELIRFGELLNRPGDPPLLFADTRRMEQEVGWSPGVPLETGLERTVDWWREHLLAPTNQ
jgi:nucleoside-diphosphate-sugar epimerase